MNCPGKKKNIHINLTDEEALVFFDWLFRFNEDNNFIFEHGAEDYMLWDLEATLEKSIGEILSKDYKTLLSLAREKVLDTRQ